MEFALGALVQRGVIKRSILLNVSVDCNIFILDYAHYCAKI